jgi:ADP-ribosylglycohydrolase
LPIVETRERLAEAALALEGLSIGDAFGERFFGLPTRVTQQIRSRELPVAPWGWTDDTAMALGVFEALRDRDDIDPDHLAVIFARNYLADPGRGYGRGAHQVLGAIATGESWRTVSRAAFGGAGSYGNGGAMRVAPIGGYFSDDLERCTDAAVASAVPTHAHPDGVAGAVAVAIAGALLASARRVGSAQRGEAFLNGVAEHVPDGAVRTGIERALTVDQATSPAGAGEVLGAGTRISAADTVPFCLWVVAWHQTSFTDVLWATVSALGDRDTTCAIVGGLLALALGPDSLPDTWRAAREPLRI